jgi:hypothetical protein
MPAANQYSVARERARTLDGLQIRGRAVDLIERIAHPIDQSSLEP